MAIEIEEIVWRFRAEADVSEVEELTEAEDAADEGAQKLDRSLGKLALGIAAVAAATVAAGAALTKDFVFGLAESQDEIAKTARQYGFTTDELQRMRFAAEAVGAPIDSLTRGAKDLRVRLGDVARTGAGPAAEALENLGLEISDLQGLGVEEQIGTIADRLNRVSDESERASISQALFGGSSAKLNNLLLEGSEGLQKLGADAEKYGAVIGGEALAESEAFQQNLQETKATVTALAKGVGNELMPKVREGIVFIRDWVTANRELIETKIEDFIETVTTVVTGLVEAVGFLTDHWEVFVGLLIAPKVAAGFTAVASGFTAMGVGAASALGPIGLIAAALVALIPIAIEAGEALGAALSEDPNELKAEKSGAGPTIGSVAPEDQAALIRANETIEREQKILEDSGGSGFRAMEARRRQREAIAQKNRIEEETRARVAEDEARKVDLERQEKEAAALIAEVEASEKQEATAAKLKDAQEAAKRSGRGGGSKKSAAASGPEEPSLEELISGAVGGPGLGSLDGRGAAGSLGGVFVRIDASFTAPLNIEIQVAPGELQGLSDEGAASDLASRIDEALQPTLRTAYEHYTETVRI